MKYLWSNTIQFLSRNYQNLLTQQRCIHKNNVTKSSIPTLMKEHFQTCGLSDEDFESIPKQYKSNCTPNNILLGDPKLAKKIAAKVCDHLHTNSIMEFDAGLGFMSEIFVQNGLHCRLYEHNKILLQKLEKKFDHKRNAVTLFGESFHNLIGMLYSRNESSEIDLNKLTKDLPVTLWNETIVRSIIIPTMRTAPLQSFLMNYIESNFLQQFGRPEIFFLVPQKLFKILTSPQNEENGRYRTIGYLYNMFCDIEILLKNLDRLSFLPWPKHVKKLDGMESMYLLRVVPKYERFAPYEDAKLLDAILVLIRTTLRLKYRVIPILESYSTGCGIQFIVEDNLTPYTEFFEISPEKYYSLIMKLKKYPEFQGAFMNC